MIRGRVYTLHLWPPIAHGRQAPTAHYTGFVPREQRLPERLTDHALGRGARLTQVQVERGGSWVLAQVEPGGQRRERQLKKHGAARRCSVCKAMEGYQAGKLSRGQALALAGWDRATEHERALLLDMFGADQSQAPHPEAPPVALDNSCSGAIGRDQADPGGSWVAPDGYARHVGPAHQRAPMYSAEDQVAGVRSPAQLVALSLLSNQDRRSGLAASDGALPPEKQASRRAGAPLLGAPWDHSDARTPQALAAANFPRGPARSLRPGSGIEDSSSQSANSAARRRPSESPATTTRAGQR